MIPPQAGALAGIRILDLSQLIAGPSSTSMLAQLGADVIKLESPAGDTSRHMGKAREYGFSATFAAYNKGKRSIALDLLTAAGRGIALRLAASSDVVIEAFRPGVAAKLGLGYDDVRAVRPDIVYVSFSGFGADGPMASRAGVDLLIQGESGIMSITGDGDGPPTKIGFTAVDAAAGFALSSAILAGLVTRLRTGAGSLHQMSLLDVALYMQAGPLTEYLMSGEEPTRTGNMAPLGAPAEVFRTADGFLIVSAYFPNQWPDLCRLLDLEPLAADPRFDTNERRIEHRTELHGLLETRFVTQPSAAWKERFEHTRIISGDVLSYSQVLAHSQVRHAGAVTTVDSTQGTLPSIAPPLRPFEIGMPPLAVPALGEHGAEILSELGCSTDEIAALRADGALR
ncbi:MAG: CaiB/BaiF CoA transferase family protein [Janthinobacterium lividum]